MENKTERAASLRGLEAFLRVAELKSFTRAAESLGLSRASMTRLVSDLEERAGAPLLMRTTRHVELTDGGKAFFERASRIMEETQALFAPKDREAPLAGELRVACSQGLADFFLAARAEAFLEEHPGLSIDFRVVERADSLVAERIDAAFEVTGSPAGDALVIGRCGSVLCASPDCLSRSGRPRDPAELAAGVFELIGQPYPAVWTFARAGETRRVAPAGRLRFSSARLALGAVLRGRGIGLLPDLDAAPHLQSGELEALLPEWRTPESLIAARVPASKFRNRAAEAFIAFAKEGLALARADLP